MKYWNKQVVKRLFVFAFILFSYLQNLEACKSSKSSLNTIVQKDSFGRTIVVGTKFNTDCSLQISINQEIPIVLSLPNQSCYSPMCDVTSEGDIIVLWLAIDPPKDIYSIYITSLPYGKEWNKPTCLTYDGEQIIPDTIHLISDDRSDLSVFWESLQFFASKKNPETLNYRTELRVAKGTIYSWNPASTHLVISETND